MTFPTDIRKAPNMREALPSALALLAALAAQDAAHAQTQAEAAAQNMQLAAELCLKNLRDAPAIRAALADTGFSVTPGANGSFEAAAFGVGVYAGPDEGGFCKVDSALVPVPLAQAIVDAVVARTYTGTVTPGLPGDNANAPPTPCQGRTLWDTRPVITFSFSAAGNSGECLSDGTSAIYLN